MSFGLSTGFGAPAASKPASLSFGTTTTTSTFGGFGTTATSGAFGGGPAAGAFGAPAASTAGAFGAPAASTAGAFGAPGAATGGFGATGATTGGLFGATGGATGGAFGAPAAAGSAFGGTGATGGSLFSQPKPAFPAASTGTLGFGQPSAFSTQQPFGQPQQQQQQQQQPQQQVEQLYNSVMHCALFGDERDPILARWNMLQASWGVGSAFHAHPPVPPLALTPENPLCRFKTVGYSAKPSSKDEDGLMSALVRQKAADLTTKREQIAAGIHQQVLMNRQGVKVSVEDVRPVAAASGDAAEVVFYVQSLDPQSGQAKRATASELKTFFAQPTQQQAMAKLGIEQVVPKLAFQEAEIKEYLNAPPKGIDPRLWKQAQLDNPDAASLLPVPLVGFRALQQRARCQDAQSRAHRERLLALSDAVEDLQRRQRDARARVVDAKRRHLALAHRVLHVMVRQEETRQIGFTIRPEEEKLRIHLEALQSEMSAPTQFKGRLNELLSQVRLQSQAAIMSSCGSSGSSNIDPYFLQDVKNVLKQQQDGIQAMVSMLKQDMADLELVEELTTKDKNNKKKV